MLTLYLYKCYAYHKIEVVPEDEFDPDRRYFVGIIDEDWYHKWYMVPSMSYLDVEVKHGNEL